MRQIRHEGRGAAVARVVEDLGDVGVVGRGGGDLRVGHEALVVAGDSGPVGEEGIKVDGTRAGVGEVEFHRQNGLARLRHRGGTNHTVIVGSGVGTGGGRRGRHGAGGEIVAEDLDSVDEGENAVGVAELDIDGSHAGDSSKGLAEVERARRLLRGRSVGVGGPSTVVEGELVPTALEVKLHLPFSILGDGRVEGEESFFVRSCRHHILEYNMLVAVLNGDPSAIGPGIIPTVLHLQCVDVVVRDRETHFHHTFLVFSERRRHEFNRITRRDRERLLACPAKRLFDYLGIHFVARTLQRGGQ